MVALARIVDEIYHPSCGFSRRNVEKWVERVSAAVGNTGLQVCDLKPLAELLGCEPEMGAIKDATYSLLGSRVSDNRRLYTSVAQALNWERTEFDTLDELLEELRASCKTRGCDLVELDYATLEALRSPTPYSQQFGRIKRYVTTTHTLLHAGELYREVTILLRTEQLVAWRTADGQEYSAPAHQVQLDPDEDGLAAAILSRIAGVEIAPEHMAELRAQMAGGAK